MERRSNGRPVADEAHGGDAYRKATELLARRPHFEREIRRKLEARGFDTEDIEATVERLLALKYLDDLECTRGFIRSKLRRSPLGRRRLRADLFRRGASPEALEEALGEDWLESDADLARRAAGQWRARGGHEEASLMRYLDRRGFTKGDILAAVGELRNADSSP